MAGATLLRPVELVARPDCPENGAGGKAEDQLLFSDQNTINVDVVDYS